MWRHLARYWIGRVATDSEHLYIYIYDFFKFLAYFFKPNELKVTNPTKENRPGEGYHDNGWLCENTSVEITACTVQW